ncbi:transthyretin-like family protein [Prochlorothrix hollandica]|uniref:Carboxypeptidase regulatory-like domain-containing protein n=1 Tax=Prochlorothrix hollandica PCC 9006 = CALU 1027 TaxID=317619 RepID=A0A0M2PXX6_PROHO|nr:carboxypeptidase-like regulatory domain-containing protein [Prochlorothrix hollandica]KKJ01291.1 hypothetical protein PROH_02710 [Prochlorothrix hollandica PCC 9006 = CALU 1027]
MSYPLIPSRFFGPLLSTLALLGLPAAALAHAVQTDYALDLFTAELGMTTTYSSGEPLEAATVKIYAPGDRETPWLETTTDDQGRFSFLPDAQRSGEWIVEIQQEGHEDILSVPVTEEGVDFNQISQAGAADVHYAAVPGADDWLLGLYAGGIGAIVAWDCYRRRSTSPGS